MLHRNQGRDIEQAEYVELFCQCPSKGKHCRVDNYSLRCGFFARRLKSRGYVRMRSRFWPNRCLTAHRTALL
jgi:hypothetical protein